MKTCSKCHITKSRSEFNKDKSKADGLKHQCKMCHRKTSFNWASNNRARCRINGKLYYMANTEEVIKAKRAWEKRNPEKTKSHRKKAEIIFKINHPWHAAAHVTFCKLQKQGRCLSKKRYKKDIFAIYKLCYELQWLNDPDDPLQVDHIIPLNGANVSGLHVPWNLQIIPRSQNRLKSNK